MKIKNHLFGAWSSNDDNYLVHLRNEKKISTWVEIATFFPGKNAKQCAYRYKKVFLKKGIIQWTIDDDLKLLELVEKYGENFIEISKFFPNKKEKELSNRYFKKISPQSMIFTKEEDNSIISIYENYLKKTKIETDYSDLKKKGPVATKRRLEVLLKLKGKSIDHGFDIYNYIPSSICSNFNYNNSYLYKNLGKISDMNIPSYKSRLNVVKPIDYEITDNKKINDVENSNKENLENNLLFKAPKNIICRKITNQSGNKNINNYSFYGEISNKSKYDSTHNIKNSDKSLDNYNIFNNRLINTYMSTDSNNRIIYINNDNNGNINHNPIFSSKQNNVFIDVLSKTPELNFEDNNISTNNLYYCHNNNIKNSPPFLKEIKHQNTNLSPGICNNSCMSSNRLNNIFMSKSDIISLNTNNNPLTLEGNEDNDKLNYNWLLNNNNNIFNINNGVCYNDNMSSILSSNEHKKKISRKDESDSLILKTLSDLNNSNLQSTINNNNSEILYSKIINEENNIYLKNNTNILNNYIDNKYNNKNKNIIRNSNLSDTIHTHKFCSKDIIKKLKNKENNFENNILLNSTNKVISYNEDIINLIKKKKSLEEILSDVYKNSDIFLDNYNYSIKNIVIKKRLNNQDLLDVYYKTCYHEKNLIYELSSIKYPSIINSPCSAFANLKLNNIEHEKLKLEIIKRIDILIELISVIKLKTNLLSKINNTKKKL